MKTKGTEINNTETETETVRLQSAASGYKSPKGWSAGNVGIFKNLFE